MLWLHVAGTKPFLVARTYKVLRHIQGSLVVAKGPLYYHNPAAATTASLSVLPMSLSCLQVWLMLLQVTWALFSRMMPSQSLPSWLDNVH